MIHKQIYYTKPLLYIKKILVLIKTKILVIIHIFDYTLFMTYRSYIAEFRSNTAEIGTALSNVDDAKVIVITMFRPSYLAISTKNQLDNLYNFLYLDEDQEKTRIVLKYVEGRLFSQFIHSTNTNKELRVQIALELLKKLLRYDEFPNSVKIKLIEEDQILLNENGVYLREIVNFTDHALVSGKEVVAALGELISTLLPSLSGAEATLVDQMRNGNNEFTSIADVYSAFRDVFIYQIPAKLEKRIYIYRSDGDVIDGPVVDEFLRQEEYKRLENEKKREEMRRDYKIDAFEQKIANQTDFSNNIDIAGFENKEIRLEETGTKRILTGMDDFEILRAAQPKTIDLNRVGKDITDSLQDIVDEITVFSKKKVAPASFDAETEDNLSYERDGDLTQGDSTYADPTQDALSTDEGSLILTDDFSSDADSVNASLEQKAEKEAIQEREKDEEKESEQQKNREKRKKKSGKKKNRKPNVLTDTFSTFAEEALENLNEENTETHEPNEGFGEGKDEDAAPASPSTTKLDAGDIPSSLRTEREYDTTKLDDESAQDLDAFYKTIEKYDRKKKSKSVKIVAAFLAVLTITVFTGVFFLLEYLKQPVIPDFQINNMTLTKIECLNTSKGQGKIREYKWEIFLTDTENKPLTTNLSENPSFTFKTPGEYIVRLTVTDKDGNTYPAVEKRVKLNFEINDEISE